MIKKIKINWNWALVACSIFLFVVSIGLLLQDKVFSGRTNNSQYDYSSLPAGSLSSELDNASITSVSTSSSGTILATTTLYFKVTSLDRSGGQTAPTTESSCYLSQYIAGTPNGCLVSISINSLASSTRLWVATTSNIYYGYLNATSSVLVATTTSLTAGTISSANTAYNDIGIARYNATNITLANGQLTNLQTDSSGSLKVIEGSYSSYSTSSLGTVVIKSGSGTLHTVCINTPAANGVMTVYNNTSAAGSLLTGTITLPATLLSDGPKCALYDVSFSTGLTYVNTGAALSVTFSYK